MAAAPGLQQRGSGCAASIDRRAMGMRRAVSKLRVRERGWVGGGKGGGCRPLFFRVQVVQVRTQFWQQQQLPWLRPLWLP